MQQQHEDKGYSQDYVDLKKKKMVFDVKPEVIALTAKPKFMYALFNLFELQVNRFANLEEFKQLAGQIVAFNQELDDWKKRNVEIKNLFITYHLYTNLFSRMKFVSNLVIDRGEGRRAYQEIIQWFAEQKPRIRNRVPQKELPQMKPSSPDREDEDNVDSLLATNINKREFKVYESMSRTVHAEFFPPKDRLIDYKCKEIVGPGLQHQRRAVSVSSLNKINSLARYRGSLASTRTSFKRTATTDMKREKAEADPLVVPFEISEQNQNSARPQGEFDEAEIKEMQKEKQVQQEAILQKNIVQVVNQEDYQEGEDEEEVYTDEGRADRAFRKYKYDPSAERQMAAEQIIKDANQSTLRRILKQKEEKIRIKLQEMNIAKQMNNWAAVKGNQVAHEHSKMERQLLANKYKQLQYVPKTFEERQSSRKKDIPEFPIMLRSLSSQPASIQREIEKLKINNALKTYGKYIQHVEIKPFVAETEEQREEIRMMRSTSLTTFCKQGKKSPFSTIMDTFGAARFNEDAADQMISIKQRLSKKMIPVQNQQIYKALEVVDVSKLQPLQEKQIYPPKSNLLSNPFFPKHLYTAKPKKKKK